MNAPLIKTADGSATVASIDLAALRHNVVIFQNAAPSIDLMGVVKADAYGHGAIPVSRALLSRGVQSLAVATIAEGVQLREAGITESILVFGAPRAETVSLYHDYNLDATITGLSALDIFDTALDTRVHLHLDTGMGRLGIDPGEMSVAMKMIEMNSHLKLEGISTHFSTAGESNSAFARVQWDRFTSVIQSLGDTPNQIHAASSGAVFTIPPGIDRKIVTTARIGVGLYGLLDLPPDIPDPGFLPVMTLMSEIAHVKSVEAGTPVSYDRTWITDRATRIATVAAGYADGVPRALSNAGTVVIGGQEVPIVGTVCMDMFMVDLGPEPELVPGESDRIAVGDPVILFGKGGKTAIQVAESASTIPYEIVCRVSARVPRIYSDCTIG